MISRRLARLEKAIRHEVDRCCQCGGTGPRDSGLLFLSKAGQDLTRRCPTCGRSTQHGPAGGAPVKALIGVPPEHI